MNTRHSEAANAPPPKYDPKSNLFTLCLNYGGKFHVTGKGSTFIGGKKMAVDYIHKDVFSLHILNSLIKNHVVKPPFRLYKHVDDDFVLMKDDNDLIKLYEANSKSGRLVELYVDGMEQCAGMETPGELETSHGVFNEEGIEESADFDFDMGNFYNEDYDLEDDRCFAKNVDLSAEWFNELSNDCDNIGESSVVECLESDERSENDIVMSDAYLDSGKDSDGESKDHKVSMFSMSELYDPTFELGKQFPNKSLLRQAIHSFAIKTHRNINITKNDKLRVHAKCGDKGCKWALHALKVPGENEKVYEIRHFYNTHTCVPSFQVKNMNAKWISGKYLHKFKSDPKRNIEGFRVDAILETKCDITPFQAYRAKRQSLDTIQGECSDQYSFLWDFAEEVRRSNPGSTVIVSTKADENGDVIYDRFYMCLDALKKGFMSGCRRFLGFDGCHLKGPHSGVLLTAVGVDPNNNIYPLAIADVRKESGDTWGWFMTLLKIDLEIIDDFSWTFMSDKQKGLITAVQEVFPNASHRFCVRHLHENLKDAGFKEDELKFVLWKAAKSRTENEFERVMVEMKALNKGAYKWFANKPPEQWSRAYFTDIPRCDMLVNNGCETFNSCILNARDKPIVSMLEWILEYMMKRMQKNRDTANEKWKGALCPRIQGIIDEGINGVGDCIPTKSDDYHYQINCFDGTKYAVDMKKRSCGCRKWDLSGIPCKHALTAIFRQQYDHIDYTDSCYRIDTYKKVYGHVIMPINGRSEWRPTGIIPPLPPNPGRAVGRPETKRRRAKDEPSQKGKKRSRGKPKVQTENRLGRQQTTIKCGLCGCEGHNKKYCPQLKSPERQQVTTEIDPLDQQQNDQDEEIHVSQYRVSQASEYGASSSNLASSRPPKSKVNGKDCQSPPTSKHATRQSTKSWQSTLRGGKCFKTPPKPFEQLQECHVECARKKKKKFISLSQL